MSAKVIKDYSLDYDPERDDDPDRLDNGPSSALDIELWGIVTSVNCSRMWPKPGWCVAFDTNRANINDDAEVARAAIMHRLIQEAKEHLPYIVGIPDFIVKRVHYPHNPDWYRRFEQEEA